MDDKAWGSKGREAREVKERKLLRWNWEELLDFTIDKREDDLDFVLAFGSRSAKRRRGTRRRDSEKKHNLEELCMKSAITRIEERHNFGE